MASFISAQAKIGFINSTRAVTETDEGKAEVSKIENWAKEQNERIQSMETEINSKRQQLRDQANILSEDKKVELMEDVDRLDTNIKRLREDTQKEYERLMREFGSRMDRKMSPLFNKYAQDNNFSIIFYISPQALQVIAYWSEVDDITDEIIKVYNATYPYQAGN
jgi:Skp family chaperone for outer membrane proteins